jgi:sterol O-acyltransferase
MYVFEKTVATFGTFALLYTVTESFIIPLSPTPDQSFFRSLLDLALPFMIAYLLLFYIIFGEESNSSPDAKAYFYVLECICNGFAELS